MNTLTQNGATDKNDTPTAFVVGVSFLYLFLHRCLWWRVGCYGGSALAVDDELNEREVIV